MLSLRRLKLEDIEVKNVALMLHESNDVILEYDSLSSFKNNFNKYFLVLDDFKWKIKAINSVKSWSAFEDNVYIISKLEDKLGIPISTLFISADQENDIHEMAEFYYDDLNDGSFDLNIIASKRKNPFAIIEWILMSNLNLGANLSIDMEQINPIWLKEEEIFNSIYPYINSYIYKDYIQVIK